MRHLTLVISATTLLALSASPTLAAGRHHHPRHPVRAGVVHAPPAYARYYGHGGFYGHPLNYGTVDSTGPIYRDGYYLGSDPDPNVRFELLRDPWYARGRW